MQFDLYITLIIRYKLVIIIRDIIYRQYIRYMNVKKAASLRKMYIKKYMMHLKNFFNFH